MNDFLKKYVPPGVEPMQQIRTPIIWLIIYTVRSALIFFASLHLKNRTSYTYDGGDWQPLHSADLNFHDVLGSSLSYFLILVLIIPIYMIITNYLYYRQGSKSIYLMRRLPQKFEIHKRALVLPIAVTLIFLITALILMLIYFAIFIIFTPSEMIAPNQWQKLWRIQL